MACSIIAVVWGVILYLILQIIKINKLGKEEVTKEEKADRVAAV